MVPMLVPPVDRQPKAIRLHNGAGDFIVAGNSIQQSTSPLNTSPSPLRKRMALLASSNMNQFKGDCVYELIGGTVFYGNVTGAFIEDGVRKTKLWNIKFDHGKEEDIALSQLMRYQKKYDKQKHQYDTEVNKKLPETTTVPTLPTSKKNVSMVEMKKKAPPKKKKTPVKKKLLIEKQ